VCGWGRNTSKQCNWNSATDPWTNPTTVMASGIKKLLVAGGSGAYTMVVRANGDVSGWGANNYKQVNWNSATTPWITPETVFTNLG
jgi:uncharacterized Fe-S cluster protein YjdI